MCKNPPGFRVEEGFFPTFYNIIQPLYNIMGPLDAPPLINLTQTNTKMRRCASYAPPTLLPKLSRNYAPLSFAKGFSGFFHVQFETVRAPTPHLLDYVRGNTSIGG